MVTQSTLIKSYVIAIAILGSLSLQAQYQTRYGTLLSDGKIYSETSLSNTLYLGIDNRIGVNKRLLDQHDSIILKTNNGKILYDSTYFILPRRVGRLRIEAYAQNGTSLDTLGYYNFKVENLPTPRIAFDNHLLSDTLMVSVESFLRVDSLYIVVSEDIPESRNWIRIREFSLGYNYGGYFIGKTSGSNAVSYEMKELVLKEGAGRYFSIKVITQSDGSLLHTKPIYRVMFY